ncbi:MAG: hypothetical protein LKI58_05795 [Actinomyces sp.]|jgi:L-alanine-DL-glutamate epimerase-like enolase superfamily enzyme|nr:enolase C-terminal domain-like protein [Actinomyces sp.]MCI1787565.1 hypothetical protein [Actinomyces sp.]
MAHPIDDASIKRITWEERTYPLGTSLRHSTADTPALEEVYCHVDFSDGTSGISEVRGNGEYATGETTLRIVEALDFLRARISELPSLAATLAALSSRSRLAAMAVDVARCDALATAAGLPLYRWLGAARDVKTWPTHLPIPFCDRETALARAAWARDCGFTRVKLRLGEGPSADGKRVELVRSVLGEGIELIADANGGWSLREAEQMLPVLDSNAVTWIEQPVSTVDELQELCLRERQVRIRADESVHDTFDIEDLARRHAADGVHLKLEKAGTLAHLREQVDAARSWGLAVALGQMDQSRLGCAVTAHLAAGLGIGEAELWGCADILHDDSGPLECVSGSVVLPQGPGIGVALDRTQTQRIRA